MAERTDGNHPTTFGTDRGGDGGDPTGSLAASVDLAVGYARLGEWGRAEAILVEGLGRVPRAALAQAYVGAIGRAIALATPDPAVAQVVDPSDAGGIRSSPAATRIGRERAETAATGDEPARPEVRRDYTDAILVAMRRQMGAAIATGR